MSGSNPDEADLSGWKGRLEAVAQRVRRPASRRTQLWVFAVASVGFVAGGIFAVRAFPRTHGPVNYFLLAIVVLLGPAAVVTINSFEFMLSSDLLSQRVRIGHAARIAVLGTAANQLPVPGAAIIRTQALATRGAAYRKAIVANLVIALAWLGSSFALAGALQIPGTRRAAGIVLAAIGAALLIACERIIKSIAAVDSPSFMTARIVGTETGLVIVQASRLFLVLRGFGVHVSPAQVVALALSGVLATALGIAPGGVGLREALAAGIGPLVGIPASASIVATAFDRIADLAVVGAAAIVLTILTKRAGDQADDVTAKLEY